MNIYLIHTACGLIICSGLLTCVSCGRSGPAKSSVSKSQASGSSKPFEQWYNFAEQASYGSSGVGVRFVFAIDVTAVSDDIENPDKRYFLATVGFSSGAIFTDESRKGALTVDEIATIFKVAGKRWACVWSLEEKSNEFAALLNESVRTARGLTEEETLEIESVIYGSQP